MPEHNDMKELKSLLENWSANIGASLQFIIAEMNKQHQELRTELNGKLDALTETVATKAQVQELAENVKALENDLRLVESVSYKTAGDVATLKLVK